MWFRMAAIAMLVAPVSAMADCNHPAAIAFAPGATSTTIASDDPVPSLECYRLTAQAGRQLGVFVESADKGAVLEIFAPGWSANCDASDECNISGTLMSDAGETDWTDTLTETGVYLIVIDNPHVDEYRLTVEILAPGDNRQ
jgi:hypothetical protein